MTKLELLAVLADVPDDTTILVDGYEGGYDDIVAINQRAVVAQPNTSTYLGNYDDAEGPEMPLGHVVVLGRKNCGASLPEEFHWEPANCGFHNPVLA